MLEVVACSAHALRLDDELGEVSIHVLLVNPPDILLAIVLHEFIGGPRHTVLVPFTSGLRIRIGDGDEGVRSGLPVGWLIPHIDEVLPSKCSGTVVDHSAFVENTDLVKRLYPFSEAW